MTFEMDVTPSKGRECRGGVFAGLTLGMRSPESPRVEELKLKTGKRRLLHWIKVTFIKGSRRGTGDNHKLEREDIEINAVSSGFLGAHTGPGQSGTAPHLRRTTVQVLLKGGQ